MSEAARPRRGWRPTLTVSMAVGLAVAILVSAFAMAVYNERLSQQERLRQAEVQLRILAGSMAAPLAFDDRSAPANMSAPRAPIPTSRPWAPMTCRGSSPPATPALARRRLRAMSWGRRRSMARAWC